MRLLGAKNIEELGPRFVSLFSLSPIRMHFAFTASVVSMTLTLM